MISQTLKPCGLPALKADCQTLLQMFLRKEALHLAVSTTSRGLCQVSCAPVPYAVLCREKLRQFGLPSKLDNKSSNTFISGSGCGSGMYSSSTAAGAGTASTACRASASADGELQLVLNQDLVAAVVKLEALSRRLEMAEHEKERSNASLLEAQVHLFGCLLGDGCVTQLSTCIMAHDVLCLHPPPDNWD